MRWSCYLYLKNMKSLTINRELRPIPIRYGLLVAGWLPVPKLVEGRGQLLAVPNFVLSSPWKRYRRLMLTLFLGPLLLVACASNPPANPDDLCKIFAEKPAWYKAALKANRQWQLPVSVGMAFIQRESSYVSDAKPPRRKVMWFIPWRRVSSAYGYAQVTDDAWQDYLDDTHGWFVERDDFADALDFIGWYNHQSHRRLGLSKQDAYHLYIAYYEGHGGYGRGYWRDKPQVKAYAQKVADRTKRYGTQLLQCEKKLKRKRWFF